MSPHKRLFTLGWDDSTDAFEVAEVLKSAGMNSDGTIKDHGFWEDAQNLYKQIEEAEEDD